ncbi:MAG TPA: hypothetical protein VKT78_04600 [Fimbriimonadaceae bacterium]|nr:hypothetical protein [Fimbriimonadaceae bacterium]
MTEIPTWWLVVSALYFLFGTGAMLAMILLMAKLIKVVADIQPQIKATAERVEEVSRKVDALADSVKHTVDDVGGRARGIMGTLEGVVGKVGKVPWIGNVLVALKVAKAVMDVVQAQKTTRGAQPKPETPAKALPKPK